MHQVEKLIKEIIVKSKDKQASYFYGVEYSSDTGPNFRATIKFSKAIDPLLCGARTEVGLRKELKRYLDGEDVKDIAIRYLEMQIKLEQEAIRFHEGLIRDYEKLQDTPS